MMSALLRVNSKRQLTADSVPIPFSIPAALRDGFAHHPGVDHLLRSQIVPISDQLEVDLGGVVTTNAKGGVP